MTEIRVNKNELVKTLSIAGIMAGKSKAAPTLDDVKCEVSNGRMTVLSFDMEVAVTRRMNVECDSSVSFCIEPNELINYLKLVSGQDTVTLNVDLESHSCTVSHDKGEYTMGVLPAIDFPSIDKESPKCVVNIPSSDFSNWVSHARRFVANDALRPVLGCMYLFLKENKIGYCSSDSHKLIVEEMPFENEEGLDISALIHSNAFIAILNLTRESDSVTMKLAERTVVFYANDSAVLCRLTNGAFPKFETILPKESSINATDIDLSSFFDSVQRTSFANMQKTDNKNIRMSFSDSMVTLQSENLNKGKKAKEKVPCTCSGVIEVGVNGEFLKDCISCLDGSEVGIYMNSERQPLIFREPDNENKTILLMPQVLQK